MGIFSRKKSPAGSNRIIIGLGNPGMKYEGTRHNIGFEVVESIADRIGADWRDKGRSAIADGRWRGRKLMLAAPQTYMNRSGLAVDELLRRNRVSPQDILVVVDDIHLDTGVIRIRQKGEPVVTMASMTSSTGWTRTIFHGCVSGLEMTSGRGVKPSTYWSSSPTRSAR